MSEAVHKPPFHLRIGAQLALLVVVAVLPLLILLAHSVLERARAYENEALNDAQQLAMLTGARLDGYIGAVEDHLDTIGVLVNANRTQPALLASRLRDIKAKLPAYVNALQAISPAGTVFASSAAIGEGPENYSVADRKYFREAIAKRRLGVGEPVMSRTTGKLALAFARALMDERGTITGVVSISIRLENFQTLLVVEKLPPGSVMTLLTDKGLVAARSLEPERWVGRDLSLLPLAQEMTRRREGSIKGISADGVERLAGFTHAQRVPWLVYVGIPTQAAIAPARAATRQLVWTVGLIVLFMLGLTALLSRRIARPIIKLSADVDRFATGDLSHRSTVHGRGEVGVLADNINKMAASLEQNTRELRAIEERNNFIINATTDGIWDIDLETGRIYTSPKVKALLGYAEEEIDGTRPAFESLLHPDDEQRAVENLRDHVRTGTPLADEFRLRAKDGSYRWISRHGQAVRGPDGNAARVLGSIADITQRKLAEEEVQRLNAELELRVRDRTAELSREIVEHKRTQRQLEMVNSDLNNSLTMLRKQTREMALLHEMNELLQGAATYDEHYRVIARSVQMLFNSQHGGLFMTRPSRDMLETAICWGELAPTDLMFAPEDCWALKLAKLHITEEQHNRLDCYHVAQASHWAYLCIPLNSHGETLGVLHLRVPIARNSPPLSEQGTLAQSVAEYLGLALGSFRLQQALRYQSIRDPLTGLYNRRYLEESLPREQAQATRLAASLGIIMFDLDNFKKLNDSYGHDAGDAVLRGLGNLLLAQVRETDIACRYGGEEFIVIIPGASLHAAAERAESIRRAVESMTVHWGGQPINGIGVSLGVAAYPEHGNTWQEVVKRADSALYRAKQAGRRRVVLAITN